MCVDRCVKPAPILPSSPEPTTSAPPPRYEHPPPYSVGWTAGRGGLGDVLIHRPPEPSVTAAQREYLRARSTTSNSSTVYLILACLVFWLCGVVFGTVAFVLAGWYIVATVLRMDIFKFDAVDSATGMASDLERIL